MGKIGAAQIITKAGPVWCHFSQKGDTVELRRFSEGAVFKVDVDDDEVVDFVPLTDCKKLVDAETYSISNFDVWAKILRKLEFKDGSSSRAVSGRGTRTPITVPITHLRQFYDVMKLLETDTWISLAQFYSRHPKSLERLWNLSRKEFTNYRNMENWGRGETKPLPPIPERVADISSTNAFTAFVTQPINTFCDSTKYSFVERELNPRRTQRGVFSDKRPATKSGTGGIDVLLRSPNGFPVVGEVKVRKDKNAFFALVQAMMYAVELSTPSQLARLKKHFGNHFGTLDLDNSMIEIVLMMVNPVEDATREPVLNLIATLNQRQACKGLGKVVLIENCGEAWASHY